MQSPGFRPANSAVVPGETFETAAPRYSGIPNCLRNVSDRSLTETPRVTPLFWIEGSKPGSLELGSLELEFEILGRIG